MSERQYHEIAEPNRVEVDAALRSGDVNRIVEAVVGLALHGNDARYTLAVLANAAKSASAEVRAAAMTGLSHVARRTNDLTLEPALTLVDNATNDSDPAVRAAADDARNDVIHFHPDLASKFREPLAAVLARVEHPQLKKVVEAGYAGDFLLDWPSGAKARARFAMVEDGDVLINVLEVVNAGAVGGAELEEGVWQLGSDTAPAAVHPASQG